MEKADRHGKTECKKKGKEKQKLAGHEKSLANTSRQNDHAYKNVKYKSHQSISLSCFSTHCLHCHM